MGSNWAGNAKGRPGGRPSQNRQTQKLERLQVDRFRTARFSFDFEADTLTFVQRAHAGLFDSGDVDENVLRAVFGLDEAEAFGRVEEFYRTGSHF